MKLLGKIKRDLNSLNYGFIKIQTSMEPMVPEEISDLFHICLKNNKDIIFFKDDVIFEEESLNNKENCLEEGDLVEFEMRKDYDSKKNEEGLRAVKVRVIKKWDVDKCKIQSIINHYNESIDSFWDAVFANPLKHQMNLRNCVINATSALEWGLKHFFLFKLNKKQLEWDSYSGKKKVRNVFRCHFINLLKKCEELNLFDDELLSKFHRTRDLRNPSIHEADTVDIAKVPQYLNAVRSFLISFLEINGEALKECTEEQLKKIGDIEGIWPSNYDDELHITEKPIEEWSKEDFPKFFRGFDKMPQGHGRFREVDFLGVHTDKYNIPPTIVPMPKERFREIQKGLSTTQPVLVLGPPGSSKSTLSFEIAVKYNEDGWRVQICRTAGEKKADSPLSKYALTYVLRKLRKINKNKIIYSNSIPNFFLLVEDLHLETEKKIKLLKDIYLELKELKKLRIENPFHFQILITSRIGISTLSVQFENETEPIKEFINKLIEYPLKRKEKPIKALIDKFFQQEIPSLRKKEELKQKILDEFSIDYLILGFACLTLKYNHAAPLNLKTIHNFISQFVESFIRRFIDNTPNLPANVDELDFITLLFVICTSSLFEYDLSIKRIPKLLQKIPELDFHTLFSDVSARTIIRISKSFYMYLNQLGIVHTRKDGYFLKAWIWHSKLAEYYLNALLFEYHDTKQFLLNLRNYTALNILNDIPVENQPRLFYELKWLFDIVLSPPSWFINTIKKLSFGFHQTEGILKYYGHNKVPEILFECSQLETIDLSYNDLHGIPSKIQTLKNLQIFNIQHNLLKELPESVGNLNHEKFSFLDASYNELIELPEELGHLLSLKRLYAQGNNVTTIPPTLGTLNNLKILDLRWNDLSAFPKNFFEGLTSLTQLYITGNKIKSLEHLRDLKDLNVIWAEDNQIEIEENSTFLKGLPSLETLGLGANNLKVLPRTLFELKDLRELYLWGNKLEIIPEDIYNLQKIELLDFTGNYIHTVSHKIQQLPNLKYLYFIGNKIIHYSPELKKWLSNVEKSLEILTLGEDLFLNERDCSLVNLIGKNIIGVDLKKYIEQNIPDLEEITKICLADNQITQLPENLFECINLKVLDLRWNKLGTLPNQIENLSSLKVLKLGGNNLSLLPESIGKLSELEELYLWNNRLTELPSAITKLKSLKILRLGGNKLTQLPQSFHALENLEQITLWGNNLCELPPTIGGLPELKILGVVCNNLECLPETITNLKGLKFLYLWGNPLSKLTKRQKLWLIELDQRGCDVFHERKKIFND
jgi:Leucine-rich repeat (LRR) protein